jgi:hypothetical protein
VQRFTAQALGKMEKWRAQGDDFRTFLSDFVANVPQFEIPVGLGL